MTFYEFNALPAEQRLAHVVAAGTYLARRWEEEDAINLYHLPGPGKGFFAEVHYDPGANELLRARAFASAAPLVAYAVSVQLPEDWA